MNDYLNVISREEFLSSRLAEHQGRSGQLETDQGIKRPEVELEKRLYEIPKELQVRKRKEKVFIDSLGLGWELC